jgi:uroporphyrinogen decarboxylase
MQPRERVLTALDHREPDRVPFDMGAYSATSMVSTAYHRFREYLGLNPVDERLLNIATRVTLFDEDFLNRMKVDTRMIPSHAPDSFELEIVDDETNFMFKDEWGVKWRMPKEHGHYFDMYYHPLNHSENRSIASHQWPEGGDSSRISGLREKAQKYRKEGYLVSFGETIGNGFLNMGAQLEGYDDFFVDIGLGTKRAEEILDKILEIKLDFWDMVLSEIGEFIDVVCERDDLGTQRSPIISLDMYRKHMQPRQKQLYNLIKRKADVKIFFHSCGSVFRFIPDFIEEGVDILNPIQVGAEEMSASRLKREFGSEIVFWGGGVDTQKVLPVCTPAQVREHVKRQIQELAPGGGYIFATDQAIQADVPPENIVAMWESLQEEGVY